MKTIAGPARFIFIFLVLACGSAFAGKVQVDAGQEVKLRAMPGHTISSSNCQVGDTVTLQVAAPVKVGSTVVIDTFSTAIALVTSSTKPGKAGRSGRLALKVVALRTTTPFVPDSGASLALTGTIDKKGHSRGIISWLLGFGLLIKGGAGELTPDDTFVTHTAEAMVMEN